MKISQLTKKTLRLSQNVKMLGAHIGSKLNFNLHIEFTCKSNQIN